MAELVITNRKGVKFIVQFDECDKSIVCQYKWHVSSEKYPYARHTFINKFGKHEHILLHRLILGVECRSIVVDHKDWNTLNNKRDNIRICTPSENGKNRRAFGKSKYMGVCKSTGRDKWQATIKANGKYKMLGRFDTEESAAKMYDKAAKLYHGEFANLNFK